MKKMISLMMAVIMAMSIMVIPANAAGGQTFSDVPTSHWAYEAIEKMADRGIVAGIGGGKFAPNDTVTTAQFATMMTRTFFNDGLNQNQPAASSDWFGKNMHVALEHELLYGVPAYYTYDVVDGKEVWYTGDVNTPLSRAYMATMMYNYLSDNVKMPEYYDSSSNSLLSIINRIPDGEKIEYMYGRYTLQFIAAVYGTGCLAGVDSAGTFNADASMTRAQACVVLDRMIDYVNANKYSGSQPSYVQEMDEVYGMRPILANGRSVSPNNVYNRIVELKSVYPQGYPCNDTNFIRGMYNDVTGCAAFAADVMTHLYGDTNDMYYIYRYVGDLKNYYGENVAFWAIKQIRVGDVLRLGNVHSVVVIGVDKDGVTVVEGNYNGIVNWGRKISNETLLNTYDLQIQSLMPVS